jgi:hypothetical protein
MANTNKLNAETECAIKNAKRGNGLKAYKNSKEMFNVLGILPEPEVAAKNIKKRHQPLCV